MPPDEKLTLLVQNIQRRGRDLLGLLLPKEGDKETDTGLDEFRGKLIKSLQVTLAGLRGAQGLFFDVGVENPIDLALLQLDLPKGPTGQERQVFAEHEKIPLNVLVR